MKLIEALKREKDLMRKHSDLVGKIKQHCADMESDESVYENQFEQVSKWKQSAIDTVKELMRLRICIQATNLATKVEIIVKKGDKEVAVTHSIAEWILRRRFLVDMDRMLYSAFTDRGLTPKAYSEKQDTNDIKFIKVRRYYDPKERDEHLEMYAAEKSLIDGKLEVINAVTDLLEGDNNVSV